MKLKSKTIYITFNTHAGAEKTNTKHSNHDNEVDKPLLEKQFNFTDTSTTTTTTTTTTDTNVLYALPKQSSQYLEHYFFHKSTNKTTTKSKFSRLVNRLLHKFYTIPFVRMIERLFKVILKTGICPI